MIEGLVVAFTTLVSAGGVMSLGWIISGIFLYLIVKIQSEHKTELKEQRDEHKKSLDALYDKVSTLQDLRVTDANDTKDEFIELTRQMISALEDLGATPKDKR